MTVVVTTYNAAQFVVETLESVRRQSYSQIELIISDDGSSDNTVELAEAWLQEYGGRFQRTALLTVPTNMGVSANCNRGIRAATADWIKFIAGDDILLPNCVEDNMRFVAENPDVRVLFSQVRMYEDNFSEAGFRYTYPISVPMNLMNPVFTAKDQYRVLLQSDCINYTPSYFFNKAAVLAVGGYDENNRLVEDYPMWLKLTGSGVRLNFMLTQTVGYRQHRNATNNRGDQPLIQRSVFRSYPFRKATVHPHMSWDYVMNERYSMQIAELFESLGLNKATRLSKSLYQITTVYLNPFYYIVYLRKRMRHE